VGDAAIKDKTIQDALEVVRSRIGQAERERAELERRIASDREEEKLLTRLLALRRGEPPTVPKDEPTDVAKATPVSQGHLDHLAVKGDTPNPAVRAVVEELVSAGRPLHISELMRLLGDKKVPIPGAGTQANLITHLRRDPRLVRPSRGMYGLVEWGLEAMPAGRRQRRRKRIKTRTRDLRKDP
jgi:hypothetical protein